MLKFKQYLSESKIKNHIDDFMNYAQKELQVSNLPSVIIINNKDDAIKNTSFGGYSPEENTIYLNVVGRHIADILRTLGHEMVHHKQNEDGVLHSYAGETGDESENDANSKAGVLMRKYGEANPVIYEEIQL